MSTKIETPAFTNGTEHGSERYEAPGLQFIGDAAEVVLGLPGGGLDGPHGMTEPPFEFEPDLE